MLFLPSDQAAARFATYLGDARQEHSQLGVKVFLTSTRYGRLIPRVMMASCIRMASLYLRAWGDTIPAGRHGTETGVSNSLPHRVGNNQHTTPVPSRLGCIPKFGHLNSF